MAIKHNEKEEREMGRDYAPLPLEYLAEMERVDLEIAGEFLTMASYREDRERFQNRQIIYGKRKQTSCPELP